MIIESRKLRLVGWALVLLVSTFLILSYSNLASYALQSSHPIPINSTDDLARENLGGRFVTISGRPDIDHSVAMHRDGVTSYWLPLIGLDSTLFVSTENSTFERRAAAGEQLEFSGKVVSFSSAPNSSEVQEIYEAKTGLEIPKSAFVLLEGEKPEEFRPMVPAVAGLALVWFFSLYSFMRVWRRSGSRSYRV